MDDQLFELDTLVFNGIDGASGKYLLDPMTPAQVSKLAQGQSIDSGILAELKYKAEAVKTQREGHLGFEGDARNLDETGWGVVLPYGADPAILDALQPLLSLRGQQAGERFKIFSGAKGYRPEESKNQFLERHGMGPGPADPRKVPYYLLLVGQPNEIPYRFQYQLDVQYAVGRLAFDNIEDYASYAHSVVLAEKQPGLPPVAAFFGVANADDRATQLSAGNLVGNLAQSISATIPSWQVNTLLAEEARKANLSAWLESPRPPAMLFSASHGIAFPNGHNRQLPHQGALVCQDWPGPQKWHDELPPDFYYAADDLSSDANLLGGMAFFFACYGAGTPQIDEFAHLIWSGDKERKTIAPMDFVARLPQRMLSLPKGGALAVVGHVDRAWGASFFWGKAGSQVKVYEDCFKRLLADNYPIGYAVEVFNERYAEISSDLNSMIEEIKYFFKVPNDQEISQLWTANNDARNYVILGDPAVRMNVSSQTGESQTRLSIASIEIVPAAPSAAIPVTTEDKTAAASSQGESGLGSKSDKQTSVDYGLPARIPEADLTGALKDLTSKLVALLSHALDEVTSLEVSTYVSKDMGVVRYESGRFTGAELRALTRIDIDGNTQVCLPESDGELDRELWQVHLEMVRQAQLNRTELLRAAASAASGLADLIKAD